jgi:hypothetical protein
MLLVRPLCYLKSTGDRGVAHIILVRVLLLVLVLAAVVVVVVVIVFIVLVLEFALEVILVDLLENESLAGEPVDRTRDELLLDVLAKLVVQLETLLDILGSDLVLVGRGLGRGEEVEEGFGRDSLLDDTGLFCGY